MKGNKGVKTACAIGAVAMALLVGVGIGACGSSTTGQETPSRPPAATQQAPSMQNRVLAWWLATGKAQSNAVTADLKAVGAQGTSMNAAALSADGRKLVKDAATARNNPPPGPLAGPWCKAMEQYRAAGQELCHARYVEAINKINRAGPHMADFAHVLSGIVK